MSVTSYRERVLDAAVRVLGDDGARALTHRRVDAAGGLPQGSTSNYFRRRDSLLEGVLTQILRIWMASSSTSCAALPRLYQPCCHFHVQNTAFGRHQGW